MIRKFKIVKVIEISIFENLITRDIKYSPKKYVWRYSTVELKYGFPTSVNLFKTSTVVNNTTTATIGGQVVTERQALSKALKPKADN